jgi:formate hydrogenlyase subunit 3/multisubunit Na+/H+ antiporter MnhD subunit
VTAFLLVAMLAVPLGLLVACLWDAPRRRMIDLIGLAPLPALFAALLAGPAPLVLDASGLRFTLALDPPAALLLSAVALLWSAAGIYARAYLGRKPRAERFAVWWLVTLWGSLGVFLAGDLISFYMTFAAVSLAAFGLIVHDGTARARRAGEVTLLLAVMGEISLLLAFALLADAIPGRSLAIADAMAALPQSSVRGLISALLVVGFGLKAGLVPLHVWLPLAHPAASMPASAVLSGAVVKAGIIGLLRFLPIDASLAGSGAGLAALGLVTAFWGVGCGITQSNPKTVLAYSTVSQMGVIVAALGMGLLMAVPSTAVAVAFYAFHHALAKGALFLAVGLVGALGGWRRGALVLLPALVLALGFGGMPGTGGALAKLAVKPQLGTGMVGALAAFSAAGSTLLMLNFVRCLAAIPPRDPTDRTRPGLLLPWLGLAAASVLAPWLFFAALGLGDPTEVFKLEALWPVLLGAMLATVLVRWGSLVPQIPEGDLLTLVAPAADLATRLAAKVARGEAMLRAWSAAGLALLALALALLGIFALARG